MELLIKEIFTNYQMLIFIFVRMIGFILIAPILSRTNIPFYTKIVFAVFLSLILMNTVEKIDFDFNEIQFIIMLIKEVIVGFLLGFMIYLYFVSFLILGELVDMQIGFSMVKVFDPQNNSQISILGNYYNIIAMLFFLLIDGHHLMIKALSESYNMLPLFSFSISEEVINTIFIIMKDTFIIGFKLSSPVMATIFLVNLFLGILAKTVPQMNVFVVGMPLKIIVGILTIITTVPLFLVALQYVFDNMYEEIFKFLKIISEG